MTSTDYSSLMIAARAGDKPAYAQLLQETAEFLRPFLSRYLSNAGDVDDVLQETLLSIHKARHTYDGNRPYKPWAFAIAKFRLNDSLRARYADRLWHSAELDEVENIADDVTKEGLSYELIKEAMKVLPPKQSAIIELLHREGLTIKEAAARLGMNESAVKVAAHRAYKVLRKKLS